MIANRELLDSDGENRALRSFLMQYSCDRAITVAAMVQHMFRSGWDSQYWPHFARQVESASLHLTKAGAQIWIRHLLSLESAPQGALTDALPELPEWTKMDNLGGLVPSAVRQAMRQYAQQCIEARNQQGDAIGAARYEFIRTLHPHEFANLWRENVAGRGTFDDLVDAAIEQRKTDKKGTV